MLYDDVFIIIMIVMVFAKQCVLCVQIRTREQPLYSQNKITVDFQCKYN